MDKRLQRIQNFWNLQNFQNNQEYIDSQELIKNIIKTFNVKSVTHGNKAFSGVPAVFVSNKIQIKVDINTLKLPIFI